jgi:hypothetical protein
MNADYRNGVKHTNRRPEPSPNGDIGDLPRGTDSPQPLGAGETDAAGPSRLPNGANGQESADAGGGHAEPSPSSNGSKGRGPDGRFAEGNPGGPGNPFARRSAQPPFLRQDELIARAIFSCEHCGWPAYSDSPDPELCEYCASMPQVARIYRTTRMGSRAWRAHLKELGRRAARGEALFADGDATPPIPPRRYNNAQRPEFRIYPATKGERIIRSPRPWFG